MPTPLYKSWCLSTVGAISSALALPSSIFAPLNQKQADWPVASTAPPSKLRLDARLLQILAGVRRGDIAIEDAALEIIEGRGLDRRSFLADTSTEFFGYRDDLMDAKTFAREYEYMNCRCSTEIDSAFQARVLDETLQKKMEAYQRALHEKLFAQTLLGMPVIESKTISPRPIISIVDDETP